MLWRIHATHHADEAMNWLTLHRKHPLGELFSLVVDLLGGRIDVDSSPGLGAIFIVRLPVVAPQPKAKPAGKEEEGE